MQPIQDQGKLTKMNIKIKLKSLTLERFDRSVWQLLVVWSSQRSRVQPVQANWQTRFIEVLKISLSFSETMFNRIEHSVQQLVDCDKSNKACSGGSFYRAWNYLMGGAMTSEYAYSSGTSKTVIRVSTRVFMLFTFLISKAGSCKFDASKVHARTELFGRVSLTGSTPAPNASAGMAALRMYGPLATNMRVIRSLYNYK